MIDIVECMNCKHNPDMSAKQREIIRAEAYQQGRADAREECIKILKQLDGQMAEIVRRVFIHYDELKEKNE